MRIYGVLSVLACCVFSMPCLGHGVKSTVFEGAAGIEVTYDDGTPMAYCEAKVFSPSDSETEFMQGATDKNGRLTFVPDVPGKWRLTVDDGMGHAVSEEIEIQEAMNIARRTEHKFSRVQGVIVGISIIFGLFGLSSFFLPWRNPR